jgi:hypothetical protein
MLFGLPEAHQFATHLRREPIQHRLERTGFNVIAALEGKGMVARQVSTGGLIPFHSDSASESADWYVNLFASRT